MTRMPGGCDISEKIRRILLDTKNEDMATETEMLLFGAAYAQLVSEVIIPALQQDKVVICSRYFDSMYVYQNFGRMSPMKHLNMIYKSAFQGIYPDITFLLDVPVKVSMERAKQRGKLDRIEKEGSEFYERVYRGYQHPERYDCFAHERIVRIDGTQTPSQVWVQIYETVEARLFGRG